MQVPNPTSPQLHVPTSTSKCTQPNSPPPRTRLQRVLFIAEAMAPRIVTSTAWYQQARNHLALYQEKQAEADEAARAKEIAPLLEELKDELAALKKAADEGSHKLVQHIYKEHPPRCGGGNRRLGGASEHGNGHVYMGAAKYPNRTRGTRTYVCAHIRLSSHCLVFADSRARHVHACI
jgi:hypothetical protein